MGSSFVLFDVSMEITQRQFRSGKSGYTQKHPYPWDNACYPWVKGLSVTTTNVTNNTPVNVRDSTMLLAGGSQCEPGVGIIPREGVTCF